MLKFTCPTISEPKMIPWCYQSYHSNRVPRSVKCISDLLVVFLRCYFYLLRYYSVQRDQRVGDVDSVVVCITLHHTARGEAEPWVNHLPLEKPQLRKPLKRGLMHSSGAYRVYNMVIQIGNFEKIEKDKGRVALDQIKVFSSFWR